MTIPQELKKLHLQNVEKGMNERSDVNPLCMIG